MFLPWGNGLGAGVEIRGCHRTSAGVLWHLRVFAETARRDGWAGLLRSNIERGSNLRRRDYFGAPPERRRDQFGHWGLAVPGFEWHGEACGAHWGEKWAVLSRAARGGRVWGDVGVPGERSRCLRQRAQYCNRCARGARFRLSVAGSLGQLAGRTTRTEPTFLTREATRWHRHGEREATNHGRGDAGCTSMGLEFGKGTSGARAPQARHRRRVPGPQRTKPSNWERAHATASARRVYVLASRWAHAQKQACRSRIHVGGCVATVHIGAAPDGRARRDGPVRLLSRWARVASPGRRRATQHNPVAPSHTRPAHSTAHGSREYNAPHRPPDAACPSLDAPRKQLGGHNPTDRAVLSGS